jgi:ribosomal protein S18 acetylase RimI-like enzyme
LPRSVSGVRLGRLAVARALHGQGIVRILLVAAMKRFLEIVDTAGGIGLFVDANDTQAKAFYERFGFAPLPSNERELFLPVATIREALEQGD